MVQDLCYIMLTAGITSLLFKLLRQPVVLGYIVAGLLVGPHAFGPSWVGNEENVNTWGEIGVLFLLFALGLEFSFKKLLQVGSTALISAGVIVVGMMAAGFFTGRLLGWSEMNSIFLGGMLCMSSTTIVFKALDDLGLRTHKFAKICFGILVVEDLFAVVLMVLLSSIATSQTFEGMEMLMQVGKLAAYLILWFVLGIVILPTFLNKFRRHLNDETLTILSIGLCLGMVLLAVSAGFSSALGAFVMGSLLAETIDAERIERLVQPVKNIFGAIFFVSVGMMIDPSALAEHWLPITVITVVVIIGQITFATSGTLLSGQTLRVSMQTGFSLVQIGEFAFIIAALGLTLGVTDQSLYPTVVAVSVVTTFLTPYVLRMANPAADWTERHLSPSLLGLLDRYAKSRSTVTLQSTFQRYLRRVLLSLVIYGVLTAFVFLLCRGYLYPLLEEYLNALLPTPLTKVIGLTLLLLISSPFLYAMATAQRHSPEARQLWQSGRFHKAQLVSMTLLRILVCTLFIAYAISTFYTLTWALLAAIALLSVVLLMYSRHLHRNSALLSRTFSANLSAREKAADARRAMSSRFARSLLSYDVHLSEFTLPAESSLCGRTLQQADIRRHADVTIVRIVRGGIHINIPGGRTRLFPSDRIVVAGTDPQIDAFSHLLDNSVGQGRNAAAEGTERTHVDLAQFDITEGHPLQGISIKQSLIRDRAQCTVIAIEHEGRFTTNPHPDTVFCPGDIVLVAGETARLGELIQNS